MSGEHSGYRRALAAEYASLMDTGQTARAAQVRAELERTGGFEDAAESSPIEQAVRRGPGRPRKE